MLIQKAPMIIAVFNLKGGTAKSTTTLNIGDQLASRVTQVTLVDMDGQRSLSHALGMDGKSPTVVDWVSNNDGAQELLPFDSQIQHLSLIPGDISIYTITANKDIFGPALKSLAVKTGIVLVDCPPALSIPSCQAIAAADHVLIPTLCEPASFKGLADAITLIRNTDGDKPIQVIRTRHKPRLVMTREADDMLVDASIEMGFQLMHTAIPENVAVSESFDAQKPISQYSKRSKAALAYKRLAKELRQVWGSKR